MTLKNFTTKHLREYEPGVFLGLIEDQPALAKWLPQSGGWDNLKEAFGPTQIEMVECNMKTVSIYVHGCDRTYRKFTNFTEALDTRFDLKKVYNTRGGMPNTFPKLMILD